MNKSATCTKLQLFIGNTSFERICFELHSLKWINLSHFVLSLNLFGWKTTPTDMDIIPNISIFFYFISCPCLMFSEQKFAVPTIPRWWSSYLCPYYGQIIVGIWENVAVTVAMIFEAVCVTNSPVDMFNCGTTDERFFL